MLPNKDKVFGPQNPENDEDDENGRRLRQNHGLLKLGFSQPRLWLDLQVMKPWAYHSLEALGASGCFAFASSGSFCMSFTMVMPLTQICAHADRLTCRQTCHKGP